LSSMPSAAPPDFPCLFPLGFHHLTMENVEQVCVDLFGLHPVSKTPS